MTRRGPLHPFLPVCAADLAARGWDALDVILVSGDAYVDHPAFGAPLVGRFLESRGFRVGLIPQPDWRSAEAFRALGRPRLFFGITAGNLDSMLNRLTAQKRNRSEDPYSPGGRTGCRPDRATIVYAQRCREAFPEVPLVLGGIEASLRRIAHYDYWSDKVRRSILLDAKADLLVFGMGERPALEIARRLQAGESASELRDIRGTAHAISGAQMRALEADGARRASDAKPVVLPPYEEVCAEARAFARMTGALQRETSPWNGRPLVQRHGDRGVYLNPPALPLEDGAVRPEPVEGPERFDRLSASGDVSMDELYELPFNRAPHPMYRERIPGFETVRHSVTLMRGCFGGCSFCSITEHQGRVVQNRSPDSVLREVSAFREDAGFRGTVTDLGGPTANMYGMRCRAPELERRCRKLSCVHPSVCPNLRADHGPLVRLMRRVRAAEGIRHAFVASGVRHDLAERSPEYVRELAAHHVGGQLSAAPEHVSPRVLGRMKKPSVESFERFEAMFAEASRAAGKEQYVVPYFISAHPGCALEDMVELALWLKAKRRRPRQVQDFIPTPLSMATCMYHSGFDPLTLEPVYAARGLREKRLQKALLLYWSPDQWPLVREALREAGREDLIGRGAGCLVPPGS